MEVYTNKGEVDPAYLLVGTKGDLRATSDNPVSPQEAQAFAKKLGAFAYIECSALKNENVETVFQRAVQTAISRMTNGGCCRVQ
jgi:hypothetical protein